MQPAGLEFGEVRGEPVTRGLTLKRNFGGALEVGEPRELPRWLEFAAPKGRMAAQGDGLPLRVTVRPPLEPGDHELKVNLPVNGEVRKKLPLTVRVESAPAVRLVEEEVFFGMLGKDERAGKTVELRVRDGVGVTGLEVESSPDYIEVELVRGHGDERAPAVKFTLLPVEEGGPFSAHVGFRVMSHRGTKNMVVNCYGIRPS